MHPEGGVVCHDNTATDKNPFKTENYCIYKRETYTDVKRIYVTFH